MDKKKVTLFIVSNQTRKTRKMMLSAAWLKRRFLLLPRSLLLYLQRAWLIISVLLLQAMENKRLKAENAQLIKQFQVVESKVGALENSIRARKNIHDKIEINHQCRCGRSYHQN